MAMRCQKSWRVLRFVSEGRLSICADSVRTDGIVDTQVVTRHRGLLSVGNKGEQSTVWYRICFIVGLLAPAVYRPERCAVPTEEQVATSTVGHPVSFLRGRFFGFCEVTVQWFELCSYQRSVSTE